jgi:hypothetical protein
MAEQGTRFDLITGHFRMCSKASKAIRMAGIDELLAMDMVFVSPVLESWRTFHWHVEVSLVATKG